MMISRSQKHNIMLNTAGQNWGNFKKRFIDTFITSWKWVNFPSKCVIIVSFLTVIKKFLQELVYNYTI